MHRKIAIITTLFFLSIVPSSAFASTHFFVDPSDSQNLMATANSGFDTCSFINSTNIGDRGVGPVSVSALSIYYGYSAPDPVTYVALPSALGCSLTLAQAQVAQYEWQVFHYDTGTIQWEADGSNEPIDCTGSKYSNCVIASVVETTNNVLDTNMLYVLMVGIALTLLFFVTRLAKSYLLIK